MVATGCTRFFTHRRVPPAGFAAALLVALAAGPALGQSASWNVDADGDWTTGSNWAGGSNAAGNGNTGTFANDITATRTVTLDANRALGTVVFGDADTSSAASWIIVQGGTSTLTINNLTGNDGRITVNALGTGATATISAPLGANVVNTPAIIKDGVGTLVLSAVNPFTANLEITAGTLEVSTDRNLGGTGTAAADRITISNGAVLATTAAFTMNANRGITIGTGGGVLDINGGNLISSAPFAGSGQTLTVTGASGLSFSNATGTPTSVNWDFAGNSGVRYFFAGSDALGTGSVQIGNGVRLVSQNVAPTGGQVSNAVTLADGAGLTARNSAGAVEYTSVSLPAAGTIVLNRDDLLTAALTIASGKSLTGELTVDTSQQGSNAVGDVTLSGVFSGTGGITKAGTGASGTLILGGVNTYGGDTTISTGTLALGASGSINDSASIIVASGATFDVSAVSGYSLGASQVLSGSGSVLGNVTALGTIAPGTSPGTLTFENNLALGSSSILDYELSGSDTTVGAGVNDLSSVAGDLTLDGTLNVTALNSFGTATVGNSWRLLNYSGTLTDNTLSLGSTPTLTSGLGFEIDTSTAGEVNLVVVPEPMAVVTGLIGLGGLGLAAMRRRRSRGRC